MSHKRGSGSDAKLDDLLQDYLLEASEKPEERVPSAGAQDPAPNARDLADELEGLLQAAATSATGPRREAIGAKSAPVFDPSSALASEDELLPGGIEEFTQLPTYAGKGSGSGGKEAWDDAAEELASDAETKDLLRPPSDELRRDPSFNEGGALATARSGAGGSGAHEAGEGDGEAGGDREAGGDGDDEGEDLVGEEPGRQTLPGWAPRISDGDEG